MKNTNITISLDTRRQLNDGTFPVIMRLGHNGRTTSIPLGITVKEADWDIKNRLIKKTYAGVTSVSRLNNLIQKKKSDAMDIIFKLHEGGLLINLSVADLKDKLVDQNKTTSFLNYAFQLVDELVKANRIGTARSYKAIANILKAFNNGKDIQFKEINYSFLCRFEAHHHSKGNQTNGLAVYMRTIRAIYNKAIKAGIVEKEYYPFTNYRVKTAPTEKRALDWDVIQKIITLDLPNDHSCFHARNYFVASYMMYGMNFIDMAFLKKSDYKNGRINYRRRKTGKLYDIKVADSLNQLLSFYIDQAPNSDFIFPIIKRETPLLQANDIQSATKRYNNRLRELAELCGINEKLTSYVSRHSFATQAMLQQVPLNAISCMLGHSSLKTTEIYLKSLPSNILDDYNSLVIGNS